MAFVANVLTPLRRNVRRFFIVTSLGAVFLSRVIFLLGPVATLGGTCLRIEVILAIKVSLRVALPAWDAEAFSTIFMASVAATVIVLIQDFYEGGVIMALLAPVSEDFRRDVDVSFGIGYSLGDSSQIVLWTRGDVTIILMSLKCWQMQK